MSDYTPLFSIRLDAPTKLAPKSGGVYILKNIINNKVYVGSTKNFYSRFSQHKNEVLNGNHQSKSLQKDANIYGIEKFLFQVIEETVDRISREQFYFDYFKSCNPEYGYNSGKSAKIWNIGYKYSKKEKECFFTEEYKEKMRVINIGRKHLQDTIVKMSKIRSEAQQSMTKRERKIPFFHKMIKIYIKSPDNKVYEIWGIRPFCEEFSLDRAAIMRVVKGQNISHKGWTKPTQDDIFRIDFIKKYNE